MSFGSVGLYETTISRLGADDYTVVYEAKPMDLYQANRIPYMPEMFSHCLCVRQKYKLLGFLIFCTSWSSDAEFTDLGRRLHKPLLQTCLTTFTHSQWRLPLRWPLTSAQKTAEVVEGHGHDPMVVFHRL